MPINETGLSTASHLILTAARAISPGDGPVLRFAACAKPAIPGLAAAPVRLFAVQNAPARSQGLWDREGYPGWLSPPAEGHSSSVIGRVALPAIAEPPFLGLADRGWRHLVAPAPPQGDPSLERYTPARKRHSGYPDWPSPPILPEK